MTEERYGQRQWSTAEAATCDRALLASGTIIEDPRIVALEARITELEATLARLQSRLREANDPTWPREG